MLKSEALKRGILWIVNQCKDYKKLDPNSKINLKSEVASYWNNNYNSGFQKYIKPIIQNFKEESINDFRFQEYLFSVGL